MFQIPSSVPEEARVRDPTRVGDVVNSRGR